MNDIKEYSTATSPYELCVHLSDKIVRGELSTFNSLQTYVAAVPEGQRKEAVLRRAFELQRKLYWGFFRDISPTKFPNVWSRVVVPDRKYHFAGDIKRMAAIPDLYMAMLDIHGYTRFCQKYRHNLSMLELLDRLLNEEVPAIAAGLGVVCRRAGGDELLLLGGQAGELFEAVYLIQRRLAKGQAEEGKTAASAAAAERGLPGFELSAGVAGGAKYAQLLITRDGDLSGTIVNTAARLQARANRISPDKTKVLLTNVACQKLKSQGQGASRFEYAKAVDFFDTGMVEFKGVNVPVFDTVFLATEALRLEYRERMDALYESLSQGLWGSRVFADALNVVARIVTSSSGGLVDASTGAPIDAADSISLIQRIKKAQSLFAAERYEQAVEELSQLVELLDRAEGRDAIVLEYLRGVRDNYRKMVESFEARLDAEIEGGLEAILISPTDQGNYRTLERHYLMFPGIRDGTRAKVPDRKGLWHRVAEDASLGLGVDIQSKK